MNSSKTTVAYNQRLGLMLFFAYGGLYLGFTLVNAFYPQASRWRPLAGINLAIWWGLLLIVSAFVLALIYGWMCKPDSDNEATSNQQGDA